MGEFANYYNESQAQSIDDLLDYESGQISDEEAMNRGILDEDGTITTHQSVWGVHDAQSLENELNVCELLLNRQEPELPKKRVNKDEFWVTKSGEVLHITKMTTQHLKNSIAFSERNGYDTPVVDLMRLEIRKREAFSCLDKSCKHL